MKENPLPYSDEKAYRIAYLVLDYIRKTLTEAEHDELDAWVEASDDNMLLFEELTDEKNIEANIAWMQSIETEKALEKTKKQLQFTSPARRRKRKPWAFIAAEAILAAIVALYLLQPEKAGPNATSNPLAIHDALLGGNKATLTLNNDTVINLEGNNTGIIENKTGTKIEKTRDGLLMYHKPTIILSLSPEAGSMRLPFQMEPEFGSMHCHY